jgi:hypothetical protein
MPSVNVVAMFGTNGVDTWNFFGRNFSNHIPGDSRIITSVIG